MRPKLRALLFAAVAVALLGATMGIALPRLAGPLRAEGTAATPAPVLTARVLDAFGVVQQQPTAGAAAWRNVSVGDILSEQTTLRTGDDSAALLLLPGGHRIRVGAKTTLVLKELGKDKNYSFDVIAGQIWSLVRKANHPARYEVETPSAVAGVTGTLFGVSYEAVVNRTMVSTSEGSVRVRQGTAFTPVPMGRMGYFSFRGRGPGMSLAKQRDAVAASSVAPALLSFAPPVVSPQGPGVRRMWRLLRAEGDWAQQRGSIGRARLNRGIERDLIRALRPSPWGRPAGAGGIGYTGRRGARPIFHAVPIKSGGQWRRENLRATAPGAGG